MTATMNRKQMRSLNAKSKMLAYYRSTMYSTDLYHRVETLYRTTDGRLYIYTEYSTCGVGRDGVEWVSRADAISHILKCDESVNTNASYTREDAEAMVDGLRD